MFSKELVNDIVHTERQWCKDYIANEHYWFVCHKKPRLAWVAKTNGINLCGLGTSDCVIAKTASSYAPCSLDTLVERYRTVDGTTMETAFTGIVDGYIPVTEPPSDNKIYRYLILPPDFYACTIRVGNRDESISTGAVLVAEVGEDSLPDLSKVQVTLLDGFYASFADGLGL